MSYNGFNFSAISDDKWNGCLYKPSEFIKTVAETYRRTVHFDSIVTIFCIILIIMPMLFKIYRFGIQTQLRAFYNRLYLNFSHYLTTIGLMTELASLVHLFINQQPACIRWENGQLKYNTGSLRVPHLDLLLACLLAEALISYKTRMIIMRFVVGFLFVALDVVGMILNGCTSVCGALSSVFFALWVICYTKFMPPIVLSGTCGVVTLISLITLFVVKGQYPDGFGFYNLKDTYFICLRGIFVTVISQIMYIQYGITRDDFKWIGAKWTEELGNDESDSGNVAEIPRMDVGTKSVDFGKTLSRDLSFGILSFGLFLFGIYVIGSFPKSTYSFLN